MGLGSYAVRRIVTCFMTLLAVLVFNWLIFRLSSFVTEIDPAWYYVLSQIEQVEACRSVVMMVRFKTRWKIPSLNAPLGLWVDHLIAYMINMFTFNLGQDIRIAPGRPIADLMLSRIPVSVFLLLPATLISIFIGIMLGVKLGANPGSRLDSIMMSLALMLYSIPAFWIQVMFKGLFTLTIRIWPATGGLTSLPLQAPDPLIAFVDAFYMLLLPIMTLVIVSFAGWMLLMRSSLMDVMGEDYILTARAKGLDEATILYKHAFRNAILPVVTGVILAIAGVWTGAVITETIFVIPGIGRLLLLAILQLDYPLCEAVFYLIALTTIIANIVADISYALLDPRVKY